jgi:hypothetical protein
MSEVNITKNFLSLQKAIFQSKSMSELWTLISNYDSVDIS